MLNSYHVIKIKSDQHDEWENILTSPVILLNLSSVFQYYIKQHFLMFQLYLCVLLNVYRLTVAQRLSWLSTNWKVGGFTPDCSSLHSEKSLGKIQTSSCSTQKTLGCGNESHYIRTSKIRSFIITVLYFFNQNRQFRTDRKYWMYLLFFVDSYLQWVSMVMNGGQPIQQWDTPDVF